MLFSNQHFFFLLFLVLNYNRLKIKIIKKQSTVVEKGCRHTDSHLFLTFRAVSGPYDPGITSHKKIWFRRKAVYNRIVFQKANFRTPTFHLFSIGYRQVVGGVINRFSSLLKPPFRRFPGNTLRRGDRFRPQGVPPPLLP